MKQIVMIPAVLVSLILFCIKPVEGAEQDALSQALAVQKKGNRIQNLIEGLNQYDQMEEKLEIMRIQIKTLNHGIEFFLTENIDELVFKADQKMVLERMIAVGIENYDSKVRTRAKIN